MHAPPLLFHDAVHRLAIHDDAVPKSQQHPQPSIPERGMLLDELVEDMPDSEDSLLSSVLFNVRDFQPLEHISSHTVTSATS